MDDLACSGKELQLYDCRHRGWGKHNCTYGRDASVECSSVRLANGNASAGRVEVCVNGIWGTVCDDSWDIHDADVVCRQLGFSNASSAPREAQYGEGADPIWMEETGCQGGEASLFNCTHSGWGIHNCVHSEDASVVCNI